MSDPSHLAGGTVGVRWPAAPISGGRATRWLDRRRWDGPLQLGNFIAAFVGWLLMLYEGHGFGADALAYWNVDPANPYPVRDYGTTSAFFYSPPVALVSAPFHVIPFPLFFGLVFVADMLALRWLVGRWVGYAMLLPPVLAELNGGNIDLPLTVGIVLGFQFPATWAAILLTKVTPGVGLLWFVVRRDWKKLFTALAVTLGLVALSLVVQPGAWGIWISVLADNAGRPVPFPIPLVVRLPLAALIVFIGAKTNRPWVVPIAAFVGIAVIWLPHYVFLLGTVAIWRRSRA